MLAQRRLARHTKRPLDHSTTRAHDTTAIIFTPNHMCTAIRPNSGARLRTCPRTSPRTSPALTRQHSILDTPPSIVYTSLCYSPSPRCRRPTYSSNCHAHYHTHSMLLLSHNIPPSSCNTAAMPFDSHVPARRPSQCALCTHLQYTVVPAMTERRTARVDACAWQHSTKHLL